MRALRRYLRLYGHFIAFSFSKASNFRFDFWFRTVMDIAYYAMGIIFFKVMYLHTPTIGGWTEDQAYIFLAGFFVIDALNMTILSPNCWFIPIIVNEGSVDYYLVRPVSSMFFLCFRDFAVGSFANLLIACGFFAWSLARYPGHFGPLVITAYIVLLVMGFIIYGVMRIMSVLPAFWMEAGRGVEQLFFAMTAIAERPDGIFRGMPKKILLSIVPLCLIGALPARFLFEGGSFYIALHVISVAFLAILLLLFVWDRGIRVYSSPSS